MRIRHLARWMRPRRVPTPLKLLPGSARIVRQPRGRRRYHQPVELSGAARARACIGALAAGNRVHAEAVGADAGDLRADARASCGAAFAEDEFAVVLGDASVGQAFARLPFDHLFFTGSTAVGRAVALAAAENLTPVTLELGGKSPAIIDADADLALAAPRLAVGKLLNAGQTCIAPDYALVPAQRVDAFVEAIRQAVAALYPSFAGNPDYTSIVNERHFDRLSRLRDDAQQKGARIVSLGQPGEVADRGTRTLTPALVVGVDDGMAIMREEIFGPLLPVEIYSSIDDAIARINARPHPLAFYWFGSNADNRDRVLRETLAGGVTVNDTLWHFAHEGLPFGGVGASGIGAYHGERSFVTFSHEKSVFLQARATPARLLYPPYGKMFERVLALLKRL